MVLGSRARLGQIVRRGVQVGNEHGQKVSDELGIFPTHPTERRVPTNRQLIPAGSPSGFILALVHQSETEMNGPRQEYLTPESLLEEELTEERLLSSHLILVLATLNVEGCRRVIEQTPYVSERCRKEAQDYLDDLVFYGEV